MVWNFTSTLNFIPWLSFPGQDPLEVLYETKLLGVILQSDLTFSSHIKAIVTKASRSLWLLARFRDMGASTAQLVTLWQQRGRSILEFASSVWFSRITAKESRQIEAVQRKAFALILQSQFKSYGHSHSPLPELTLRTPPGCCRREYIWE